MLSVTDLVIFWLLFDLPYLAFRFTQYMVPLKTREMKDRPLVTILIPAYNEERVIFKTLLSCVKQTYSKLEIVVIDDGSTDGTSRVVTQFQSRYSDQMKKRGIVFKHIMQKNTGKAGAMNTGLRNSHGEFVVSIDADSFPHYQAVERILRYFTDEKVGAVAGHIVGTPRKRLLNYLQYVEYEFGMLFTKVSQSSTSDVLVTPGAFSIYRREALKRFEDKTVTEDFDTSVRIIERGYKIVEAPDAVCYTQLPASSGDLIKQRVRWYQGGLQVFAKHFDHSKRTMAHVEMFLIFLYGFYGTMIRTVSLILIPLMFYMSTGSTMLGLLVFMVYSLVVMFIQFIPVYMRNKDLKMFVAIPFFIFYNFSILLYSSVVGQVRMFKKKVSWSKLIRYPHDAETVSAPTYNKKDERVPYLDDFLGYSFKVSAIFVMLFFGLSYVGIYNTTLVIIASMFIAFTFKPIYMISFISAYPFFYYLTVLVELSGHSEFLPLFIYMFNMLWNMLIVVWYIKANYDLVEIEDPEGVTAPREVPVTYARDAGVEWVPMASMSSDVYTTSAYRPSPAWQGSAATGTPTSGLTGFHNTTRDDVIPVALPLTSITLPQHRGQR